MTTHVSVTRDELPPAQALWLALALSMGAAVSLGITRFAYALLLPPMRADLGWSYAMAGADGNLVLVEMDGKLPAARNLMP